MSSTAVTWIVLGIIVAFLIWIVMVYNGLIAMRQRVNQAFSDIDVQTKQRHDLVPNLVETVKGYASHERGTLEAVVQARNAAVTAQAGGVPAQAAAENALSGALRQLFALSEAYPDLKASQNFQQLQRDLSDIENKIAAARRFFNNAVQEYNTGIAQFPAVLLAGTLGFTPKDFFDVGVEQRKELEQAPQVKFEARRTPPMAAYGLYTHIQANKRRSAALLIGLFFLVYVLVYAGALIGEAMSSADPIDLLLRRALADALYAAPFATAGTALWILIAYKFHQSMIDAVTGGREVSRQDQPRLYNLLETLCISRGISMPKLKVIEDSSLNAFAAGMNDKQYSITVTSGLMDMLDDAEIELVLGHELTHIRNGDVRLLVIAVIIAGVVSFFAELVYRLLFQGGFRWSSARSRDDGRKGAGYALVIALALIAVAWILSIVIRFALSRQREFLADAGSVELTKNPDAMISALRKIEGRGELPGATSAVMEMCIDNPRQGFSNIFDTHPSVDARVASLVRFAGGHDPGPLALPSDEPTNQATASDAQPQTQETGNGKPFLPDQPPVNLGSADGEPGPWGPHRR